MQTKCIKFWREKFGRAYTQRKSHVFIKIIDTISVGLVKFTVFLAYAWPSLLRNSAIANGQCEFINRQSSYAKNFRKTPTGDSSCSLNLPEPRLRSCKPLTVQGCFKWFTSDMSNTIFGLPLNCNCTPCILQMECTFICCLVAIPNSGKRCKHYCNR